MNGHLAVADVRRPPHPTTVVFRCMACTHWQLDLDRRYVADVGSREAMLAVAQENAAHVADDCPGGTEGRVKYGDRWVGRPLMEDGKEPTGLLEMIPLPAWWVSK